MKSVFKLASPKEQHSRITQLYKIPGVVQISKSVETQFPASWNAFKT